jgi:origin recognition complex subunit 3
VLIPPQSIIAELYNPVVSEVVDRLENIHADVLPGLPFPELPVITIADLPGGSIFLEHLTDRLDENATIVNHLYPSDCPNLTSAMKNLIGSFLERDSDAPKRKPAASLAPYDLNLLQAWYDAAEGTVFFVSVCPFFNQVLFRSPRSCRGPSRVRAIRCEHRTGHVLYLQVPGQ